MLYTDANTIIMIEENWHLQKGNCQIYKGLIDIQHQHKNTNFYKQ